MDSTRLHKRIKLSLVALIALPVFAVCTFSTTGAHAETYDRANITKKAMLQGLHYCVANNSHFIKKFKKIEDFKGTVADTFWGSSNNVPLPSGANLFYHGDSDAMIDCDDVLGGDSLSKVSNAFQVAGHPIPAASASNTTKKDWLIKYGGYRELVSDDGASQDFDKTKCFKLSYPLTINVDGGTESKIVKTDFFCLNINSSTGLIVSGYIEGDNNGWQNAAKGVHSPMGDKDPDVTYDPSSGAFGIRHEYLNSGYWTASLVSAVVKGVSYDTAIANIKQAMTDAELGPKADMSSVPCYDGGSRYGSPPRTTSTVCQKIITNASKHDSLSYQVGIGSVVDEKEASVEASPTNFYYVNGVEAANAEEEVGDPYRAVAYLLGYTGTPPGKVLPKTDGDGDDSFVVYARRRMHLSPSEKVQVYMDYLNDPELYDAQVNCQVKAEDIAEDKRIYWYEKGKNEPTPNCAVMHKNEAIKHGLNALNHDDSSSGTLWGFEGKIDYDGLIAFFKDPTNLVTLDFPADTSAYASVDPTDEDAVKKAEDEDEDTRAEENERTCYDSAGSSNWIACPIIENSKSASETMYGFIENLLQVNTGLFSTSGKVTGTLDAWGNFRNIANIAFIVVFIVVILSQVTGFGIDNYGVKKILPKLIIGALLVNVSFYACQASVDVGNIVGGGIKNLFEGLESTMTNNQHAKFAFDAAVSAKEATGWSAAALLAAIVGAAWYFSGGSIVVPILLGVIAVVIGIIFLLVLLAVRQGLAVILVVISPLAFIAYMLPNTKGLFSKWLKLLSATLLAYPLCSLAVYGGQMVSTILLLSAGDGNVTNFALALTAAILSIAPVFFIPMLITKSMSGISTVANGLKNRATSLGKSAFDRSHTADNMRNVAKARKDNMNAGRARRTKAAIEERRKANGGRLGIADRARLRTANNTIDAFERGNESLYAGMVKDMDLGSYGTDGAAGEGLRGMAQEAITEHDMEKLSAVIERMNASGNEEAAQEVLRRASSNVSNMSVGELEKFKNITAQKGGTLGKAYVKALAGHMNDHGGERISFDTAMKNGAMKGAIDKMGENALAGMNKDEMSFLTDNYADQLDDLFTSQQIANAAATHTSGKAGTNFAEMLSKMSDTTRNNARASLSAEQWAKANEATLDALGFSAGSEANRKMAQAIIDSGDGDLMNSISSERQKTLIAEMRSKQAADQVRANLKRQDSENRYRAQVENALTSINEQLKNNQKTPPDGGTA